ncbi:hypothetical protein [uncultured Ruegeria sp.]|nr:hypothetical protein [uncultured Ruegeria sp.]
MAIKAASLPARATGTATFELARTALPVFVMKRGQCRITSDGQH